MSKLERKLVTVVSVEYDLDIVEKGERLFIQHEPENQYDEKALKVLRGDIKIGMIAASSHTVQKGCVTNADIFLNIPSKTVPLVGKVVDKKEMQFKNGDIVTALILAVDVVNAKAS